MRQNNGQGRFPLLSEDDPFAEVPRKQPTQEVLLAFEVDVIWAMMAGLAAASQTVHESWSSLGLQLQPREDDPRHC